MQQHIVVLLVTTEKPIQDLATKIAHRVCTLEGKVDDCVAVLDHALEGKRADRDYVQTVPTGSLAVQFAWAPKIV